MSGIRKILNSRQWFHEHHDTYLKYVREPLKELVNEMGPMMLSIDPQFDIESRDLYLEAAGGFN